jgi:hypothetical protein
MIALILVVALLLTAVTPARAEAMEVGTILLIAGGVIIVVIIVAYLIVASASDRRRAESVPDETPLVFLAAAERPVVQGP